MHTLRAPFPYFGGKRRVAELVWRAFGDVSSYVEPFCGSCAVLLARPDWHRGRVETINDASRFVANFWRAVANDPEEVARWADWPVNEADLHARHKWLAYGDGSDEWRERMHTEPDYYDAKRAGWWVWGQSAWIGEGWCRDTESAQLPHLGDPGRGVAAYMQALSDRLRRVRVACGDWSRVTGDSVLNPARSGVAGVFLDPPYSAADQAGSGAYGGLGEGVSRDVSTWAIERGSDPALRIVLCGYECEHDMPNDWRCVVWKAAGGYESQRAKKRDKANSTRERLWLSPHCLDVCAEDARAEQKDLFGEAS